MNKKKIIFWCIVILAVIVVIVFMKFSPLWVSLTTVVSFGAGAVIGWVAKILYDKYIKQ